MSSDVTTKIVVTPSNQEDAWYPDQIRFNAEDGFHKSCNFAPGQIIKRDPMKRNNSVTVNCV